MPKSTPIKYRPKDLALLRREIKNFNARLARQLAAHPERTDILPKKMTMKEAKKQIATRADFNFLIKTLKGFTPKTAEVVTNSHGVKSTKFSVWLNRRQLARVNAKRRVRTKIGKFVGGKQVQTPQEAAENLRNKPVKKRFEDVRTQSEWESFSEYYDSIAADTTEFQEADAYLDELKYALTRRGVYTDELWNFYKVLGAEKILQLYYSDCDSCNYEYVYNDVITAESKKNSVKVELGPAIQEEGKQREFLENLLAIYPEYDSKEIRGLWEQIGYNNIFQYYLDDDISIFNPDDLHSVAPEAEPDDEEE